MQERELESVKIFGVRIDVVTDETAYQRFEKLIADEGVKMIFTPNPEFIMKAQEDDVFFEALSQADLVIPDGIGLIIASKIHKLGLSQRVTGVEMMTRILEHCNRSGKSIYLLGGKPGVAEMASRRIQDQFPHLLVKGYQDGYYDQSLAYKVVDDINEKKPDVVFVGLGSPRQEIWISKNKKILNTHVAMGVGGAIDVFAGTVKRAPKWTQSLGIEWLYRLIKQPSRFRRMLVLPKFLLKVLTTKNIEKRF